MVLYPNSMILQPVEMVPMVAATFLTLLGFDHNHFTIDDHVLDCLKR